MIHCAYYLDVLSQWCFIADYAVRKLEITYAGSLQISCLLVPMDKDALPDRDEQARVYRRSRYITGVETIPWISADVRPDTFEANAIVVAASKLGADFDAVRKRIAEAGLLEGTNLGDPGVATALVSQTFGIDAVALRELAFGEVVAAELAANKEAFLRTGSSVKPTFVLKNEMADYIVLGGQYDFGVLATCIQSLSGDEAAYSQFERT
jgi:predicted DsbA family dithiol-disulfide isomerase